MKIAYPMACIGKRVVNITEANHDGKYTCIECKKPMIAKLGKIKIHHFAHKYTGVCNPDNVLHETSKYNMRKLFNKEKEDGKDLIISIPCIKCKRSMNYTLPTRGTINVEFSIINNTRSDLVVLNKDGSVHSIIEIVVTHDLEQPTHDAYLKSKIPVIKITPIWKDLRKVTSTININKICDSCNESKMELDAIMSSNMMGWWIKSEMSKCWGIFAKNYHLREGNIVKVITKGGNAQIKKLGCELKDPAYGLVFHVDDSLTEDERTSFKDPEAKRTCTWKSIWCVKVYDPENTILKGDIIKVSKGDSFEFEKLGCLLSRDRNTKIFHTVGFNYMSDEDQEKLHILEDKLYERICSTMDLQDDKF